jgi:hypothetical protein
MVCTPTAVLDVAPDMKLPGGIVTNRPGLRTTKRKAGTRRSARVVVPRTLDLLRSHSTRIRTRACIKMVGALVVPEKSLVLGRLRITPGLRRANIRAGTITLVDVISKGIYY